MSEFTAGMLFGMFISVISKLIYDQWIAPRRHNNED